MNLIVQEPELWLGYIRVSTWREEKISPEIQLAALKEWERRTGRRLLDVIVDLDVTGRNFNRKIQGAIEAVESGKVRGIAVWRFSRFGRNRTGNNVALARLEAVGGELESATEPLDAKTAVGELQREMIFAFGNFESNRAGEQWRETHAIRRELKLPATGRPRFGYTWFPRRVPDANEPTGWRLQKERYELHDITGPVAEEMLARKLRGGGFNGLAHWLNEELMLRTTRGGLFGTSTIARYMDSGFAAGLLKVHDPECRCGYGAKQATCPRGNITHIAGAHPGIWTPDEWEEYQEHRKLTKNTPPRARKATYPLTGLCRCGHCRHHASAGSHLVKGEQVRGHHYVCSRNKQVSRIACPYGLNSPRKLVEQVVENWLKQEAAADIDAAPATSPTAGKALDTGAIAATARARMQSELAQVDQALDRLVTDSVMNPGKYPEETFNRVRNQLAARKGVLVADLAKVSKVETGPTREGLIEIVVSLAREWDTLLTIEKNALLLQVLRRVIIRKNPPPPGKQRGGGWTFVVHPAWGDDPWERKICRHVFGARPDWTPDSMWAPTICDGPFGGRENWTPDSLWARPVEAVPVA
ncbi:recombinase family protein [Streptomyces sp. NPDC059970]|uniref:recombinase family protein n=1 Tax=Streptomyces sp. NPDC059970 TaxID=3347019 RepID=UPI00368645A3